MLFRFFKVGLLGHVGYPFFANNIIPHLKQSCFHKFKKLPNRAEPHRVDRSGQVLRRDWRPDLRQASPRGASKPVQRPRVRQSCS